VLIANSLVAPRSINIRICSSGYLPAAGDDAAGGLPAPATGAGAAPSVCPPPGKEDGEVGPGFDPEDELEAINASCSGVSSGFRALSGSSCSDRKPTSRPWIRKTFLARSIHAWWALSMSSPKRRSTSRPCHEIYQSKSMMSRKGMRG
jgi:hypothetical protein